MRTSLFWKLFASHLGAVLVTIVCVSYFATAQTDEKAQDTTQRFLLSKLALIETISAPALRGEVTADSLQATVDALDDEPGTRYTVIAADGRVYADSDKNPREMEDHGSRPEVVDARRTGEGTATRYSSTLKKRMVYVARRVDGESGLLGFVRVSLPVLSVDRDRADFRDSILMAALLAMGLGFLPCVFLANRFVRPLRQLTKAATSFAAGGGRQPVPTDRADQIGDLARAFDTMADNLRERIDTITNERRELEAILGGMVEGVVAIDDESRVVMMNEAAGRILDVDTQKAQGRDVWEAIPLRPVAELVGRHLATAEVGEAEVQLPGPPADRVLQLHAAPLNRQPSGQGGMVIVMHDITALRRLERVRRDFVANASHELKTPIAAIRGLLETILEDAEMDPETERSFLGRAHRQTGRLSELIEEMLALSRLEERADMAQSQRLDLREAIAEATETMLPLAAERGVMIERNVPDAPVFVMGTGESLQRIVGNLLENAVKFTNENTSVHVRLAKNGAGVQLEIQDEGPGIPARERERIFERFYRVDRGRSRDVGGTGLGLAIVKHLVLRLGGDVEVEGDPGEGSLFRVRLPSA
ncbi:MAG: ATP-binding protein [Planctomycetota bacterium]|nr:ATP-binding protein [Planctomycetota bacterium]